MTVPTLAGQQQTYLEQEIPRQGAVLRTADASFSQTVDEVIAQAVARGCDDWVVTGCGDSLFAGMCAEVWFAQIAGRRLRAVHAMELSRYLYQALTPRSVVLAVSHSGTTARVLEAARAARSRGAYVVAVTANPDSELALLADTWIDNSVRDERSNTRTASFQAVSLLMRRLAQSLAGDAAAPRLASPAALADAVEAIVEPAREQVAALDEDILRAEHWLFVGAGHGHAVAEYGMAKMYEAATLPAHAAELEQMIHSQIFTIRAGTVVVVICPRGRGLSRAQELVEGLEKLGASTIVVTNDEILADAATASLRLPVTMDEQDLPFLSAVPLQWLALRVAQLRGANPDLVENKTVNRPLIDLSAQWSDADYAAIDAAAAGVAS